MFRILVHSMVLAHCSTADALCSEGLCEMALLQRGSELVRDNVAAVKSLKSGQLVLGIKHMSKTGGSNMIDLVNRMAVTLDRKPLYTDELTALTPERKANTFVISAVRNPCDWYVSLHAFESLWTDASHSGQFFDGSGNNANVTKFANWLRWALGETGDHPVSRDALGVMSLRYWDTLISQDDLNISYYDGQVLDQYVRKQNAQSKQHAMASFDPTSLVDCWVYEETYNSDLAACLRNYERLSGAKLDWTPFKMAAANNLIENPSQHQPCWYYYSPELADLVMTHDRYMFDKFGYRMCCRDAEKRKRSKVD